MLSSKIFFSFLAIVIGVLHTLDIFRLDAIGLAIFGIATLPWISRWLKSIKVGDFEAEFRELKAVVEATQNELDQLKLTYQEMEVDFIKSCKDFDPEASSTELNQLATNLKAKAKGLISIDFIFKDLVNSSDEALIFGAACALSVRPQFHAIDKILDLFLILSESPDMRGVRLKTIYRLLMALDEIIKLDYRNRKDLLTDEQRERIKDILIKIKKHPKCLNDDTATYANRIILKINKF